MEGAILKGKPIFYKGNVSLAMLKDLGKQLKNKRRIEKGNNYCFKVRINKKEVFVKVTKRPSVFEWIEPLENEFDIVEKLKRGGVSVPSTIGYVKIKYREMFYGIAFYQFIEGKPFGELLFDEFEKDGKISEEMFINLIIQIAKMHALNIMHHDLHCGNVIMNSKPYLIDFEIAKEFKQKNSEFWATAYAFDVWKLILAIDRIAIHSHPSKRLIKAVNRAIGEMLNIYLRSTDIEHEIWKGINDKYLQLLRVLSPVKLQQHFLLSNIKTK